MSANSRIEWTETTWNPVTGCTKISPGCKNCYAEIMAKRLKAMGHNRYKNGFELTCHPEIVDEPLGWKKPRMVFVNSMSDLFHQKVPISFIKSVFFVMGQAHSHTFQVLTKRSSRLKKISNQLKWHKNIWIGVSVEDKSRLKRIDDLRNVPAYVRFVSAEPLLEDLGNVDLSNIDWLIAGGESGPRARPMKYEWVCALRDNCLRSNVPFFFKQWGGVHKKLNGRHLDGRLWNQMPVDSTLTPMRPSLVKG